MIVKAVLASALLAALIPSVAKAKCGTGNQPSYDDIDAVMFTQNGCNSTIQDANVATLKSPYVPQGWFASTFVCSTFWVLFWNNGRENVPTTYSQYDLRESAGTFTISATLDDARTLLRKDRFYELYPSSRTITDTARAVISVKRCAVVTRISVYNVPGSPEDQDAATLTLFDDLRALVSGAAKSPISSSPKDFGLTGLFDP
jgi:hypothetical protein